MDKIKRYPGGLCSGYLHCDDICLSCDVEALEEENAELKAENDAHGYTIHLLQETVNSLESENERLQCCGNCAHEGTECERITWRRGCHPSLGMYEHWEPRT